MKQETYDEIMRVLDEKFTIAQRREQYYIMESIIDVKQKIQNIIELNE